MKAIRMTTPIMIPEEPELERDAAFLTVADDCALFGKACTPEFPVGACMVSAEGTCKIWHQYGGRPDLRVSA